MKPALGRGLDTLLPEKGADIQKIEIEKIRPNKKQPRKVFDDASIAELANSIKEKGLLQPIIVSRVGDGTYNLIAGERRWRACKIAGLKKIPAIIKDISSKEAVEIALIENIQREDLNPLEIAFAFDTLLKEFNLTQEELSSRVSKDRATIANYIRLLKLPEEIKAMINQGSLTIGHAKAILSADSPETMLAVAKEVVKKGLTVRETERLIASKKPKPSKETTKLAEVIDLEEQLKRSLGCKVTIKHKGTKGKIEIQYFSLDELDRILEILKK